MISVTIGPIDNTLAKRRLTGWKPTALESAIKYTVQWFEKDPIRVLETLRKAESSSSSSSGSDSSEGSESEGDCIMKRTTKRQRCDDDDDKSFKFNFSM